MKISSTRTASVVAALSLAVGIASATATPASAAISVPEHELSSHGAPISPGKDEQSGQVGDSSASVTGSLSIAFFWNHISLDVSGGKHFVGDGGVTQLFGAGWFSGTLHTDNIEALYRDTVSYNINGTPLYTNVNFFDSKSHLLGHLQTGSVSIFLGTGGGTGSWR